MRDVITTLRGVPLTSSMAGGFARACAVAEYDEGLTRLMRMETEGELGEPVDGERYTWGGDALDEAASERSPEMVEHITSLVRGAGLMGLLGQRCIDARDRACGVAV